METDPSHIIENAVCPPDVTLTLDSEMFKTDHSYERGGLVMQEEIAAGNRVPRRLADPRPNMGGALHILFNIQDLHKADSFLPYPRSPPRRDETNRCRIRTSMKRGSWIARGLQRNPPKSLPGG